MVSTKKRIVVWGVIFALIFTTMFGNGMTVFANNAMENQTQEVLLPNATVNDMGKIIVSEYDVYNGSGLSNGGEPIDLQIALQFLAKDTPQQAAQHPYGQATTDFYIQIDGLAGDSFTADDDCYLAGNYGPFGWIMIPLEGMEIESGKVYPVITSVGFNFTYEMICKDVKDFKCGIHLSDAVLADNPDLNVTLELGLSESLEEAQNAVYRVVDSYSYDVEDLEDIVLVDNETISSIVDNSEATREDIIDIVTSIANNGALKEENYEPDLQEKAVRLDITLTDMTATIEDEVVVLTTITYDVTPKTEEGEKVETFEKKVTFRLPVPASVASDWAKVTHEKEVMGVYPVQGTEGDRFVEISSAEFSAYKMEFVNSGDCEENGLEHNFDTVQPGHDADSHWRVCVCGKKEAAEAHEWSEYVDENNATCEKDGTKVRNCPVCGREERVDIAGSGGHQWDEGVVTTAAECGKAGVKTYTCQRDKSHTTTEAVAALEHSYEWKVVKEATVKEEGLKKEICGLCGGSRQEEVIPRLKDTVADKPEEVEPKPVEPEGDKPAADKPEVIEPKPVEPEGDKPVTDKPEAVEPETDEPADDKPVADEPETVEPETDEPEGDKPVVDEPADDEPAADEPEAIEPETEEAGKDHFIDEVTTAYVQGSGEELSLRGNGDIEDFRAVKVDGVTVDAQYYTVTEGSTIITFAAEYLDSLSPGKHKVEMVWTTGKAFTEIEIEGSAEENTSADDKEDAPDTGDANHLMVWILGIIVSGIALKRKTVK